jgi:hypothetical protein
LQKYAIKAGAACRPLVQLLLPKLADSNPAISVSSGSGCKYGALAGLTPLHMLACCSSEIAFLTHTLDNWDPNEVLRSALTSVSASTLNSVSASNEEFLAVYEQQLMAAADVMSGGFFNSSSSISSKPTADVNARTAVHGETPLTFAAYAGASEAGQLLLKHGADPNMPRLADGSRPLDLAAKFGSANLACALIEHGAEVGTSAATLGIK